MSSQVLRDIAISMQQSPFTSIMVDETTDVSNIEQITVVVQSVSDLL